MKKNKVKLQIKSAKKELREEMKASLVAELQVLTDKLGIGSKKMAKEIEKGSERLAKKLLREIKIDRSKFLEAKAQTAAPELTQDVPAQV